MKALLVLVAAFGLVAGLAALFVPSPAATVGGTGISRTTLDNDLSEIASSADYTCYLSEEGFSTLAGAGVAATPTGPGGVYSTTFADEWLRTLVLDQLRARLLARRGLTVGAEDLAVGREVLTHQIEGALTTYATDSGAPSAGCGGSAGAVLASMKADFVNAQVLASAQNAELSANALGDGLGLSGKTAYYNAHQADFDKLCYDVLEFGSATAQTHADKVAAAIAAGTSFTAESAAITATTAQASSQHATSGCGQLGGSTPPELAGAIGQIAGPVEVESGLFVIAQVTSRTTQPLSSVAGEVLTSMVTAGEASLTKSLKAEINDTSLTIDPRYGSLSLTSASLIDPPTSPPSSSLLSLTANEPTGASPIR